MSGRVGTSCESKVNRFDSAKYGSGAFLCGNMSKLLGAHEAEQTQDEPVKQL